MPRSLLASVISAAKHCLTRSEWHEDAVEATRLLLTFCGFSFDSRTLVRAIDAGVLDLLWEIGRCNAKYDTLPLAGHIAGSMGLATALRAAKRAYGRILDFLDMDGIDRGRSIAIIREAYALHYRSYFGYRQRKDWKKYFSCHNAQGPHNSTVRICACGRTFYCSGSCQRMHWYARHRSVCSGYEPWSMKGRVSLNDALFLAVHVRERIRQWQPNIVKMIAPDIDRLRPNEQFSITVDISDPLVQKTGDVYIEDVAPYSSSDVVLIKVCFRVGCVDRIQPMPFTYRLADFRTVKKLS
ncbi:uncharacterized protein SCHCODRAFT_02669104 [Schizophyllum commune H4-8]|uniref:Expressed protein n=1 Tax=Schizophyllum commune (strain H4-8 / FGSC 9210) TaxID=578458 RepID=D8Q6P8_SCHCM|nr:uncharacterized protein SCHCODRAFT_02669104 [Schizophyllum commune H4-8]KAI5891837.1 hypothetical protein SCHCODRAFT_02669104 [Schizophyllum commune H4-8]